jgi:Xaa-Pro aminopeptidase
MNPRIKKVCLKLKEEGLDGLLLSSSANISYLTGYPSRDSYLLITPQKKVYITDFRYLQEARIRLKGYSFSQTKGDFPKVIAGISNKLGLGRIGFEERDMAFADYRKIKQGLAKTCGFIPVAGVVEKLREVKSSIELASIRKAVQITVKALQFAADFISPGKKEIEVAGELERFIRYCGGRSSAFDIIVASGPNSSFPHHLTSQRRIGNNEPVLLDIGVEYSGYKSDLTRVFFLGKINLLARKIYDIVLGAQEAAIKRIKPGIFINKIDTAARQYISKRGYGGFFGHSLGHGIGLSVHEAPNISSRASCELKAGMVFTLEPAIYLPGKLGIRLEDMVLVTKKGVEVISGALHK